MKKVFATFLSCLLLVSSLNFGVIADDGPTGPLGAAEPEDVPLEYATRVANIATNFAWAFSGGGKLLFGSCLSGGIVGIVDVAMDLLGQVVYFGPSEEEMQRQELMDKLSSIDASIGDVSSKVDSLADQINASIKIIDAQLDNISIKLDKDNISNVASIATSLRNEMNNYDTVLNSQIHTWYENKKLNDYLTAGSFILKVPNGQQTTTGVEIPNIDDQQMNDLDVIFVDDDLMSSTINSYIQEKLVSDHNDGWNADEKDDIVKEIFKRIILSDSFNKNSGSEFDTWIKKVYPSYTNWDVFTNKDEAIEKISSAGYASLCEIAAKNIAKTSNGADTYAKQLIEKFTLYCNYLTEANGEYTSPLASYANIYSSIYAFQGDLKRSYQIDEYNEQGVKTGNTITENTNLLKMNMEKYLSELNQLGTFVGIMAKASGNYGENTDMRKLVYIPWAAAEKKLKDDYAKYYHIKNGAEVDNYCYITKTVLGYYSGTLGCDLVMKFYAWENGFGTDIKSYRDTYMATDWNYTFDNTMMVDSTSMNLIYAHYANTYGNVLFKDYLEKNDTGIEEFDDDNLPPVLITKFIGGRDFTSDDKVKMFVKNCHNNPDKWEGKDYTRGDTTTVTSSSKYFKVRRKATADVFDLNTGVLTQGKRIGAVASFYEKYTFKDDLVVFWDAEYNNPQNIDELKALAEKDKNNGFYWRDRYDTSSDDEERYRSHVEYVRAYGTLLSFPLDLSSPSVSLTNKFFGAVSSHAMLQEENNPLLQALKDAGVSKQEYTDFIYDDTYRVYFDETKYNGTINQELYVKLIQYCQNDTNINKMTNDYYSINDQTTPSINNLGNNLIVNDREDVVKNIANKLIENDLDCKIVDSIPSENIGNQIYNSTNGKLFIWNNGSYVEYDPNANIASKGVFLAEEDTQQHEGVDNDSEIFTSKFSNKVMNTGDYPCDSSSNLKLAYTIKTVLYYELYLDGEEVKYRIHPVFDVVPVLKWKDGGVEKEKELSSNVLAASNISSMKIMIPILNLDKEGDNRAVVKHFVDLDQMENPIETFHSVIKTINGKKYSQLSASSFSPYSVSSTYYEEPINYSIPNTSAY